MPRSYIFRPDFAADDAMIARTEEAIAESRRVLALPHWPGTYLPPPWPEVNEPADARFAAGTEAAWATVSGSIRDRSK